MCNYSNVPVSKHNSFPSASKAWQRISWFAASYGGALDQQFYKIMLAQEQCHDAIAELQAAGVQFTAGNCYHWAVELCGSFDVTHPQYQPPAGSELPAANVLYTAVYQAEIEQRGN